MCVSKKYHCNSRVKSFRHFASVISSHCPFRFKSRHASLWKTGNPDVQPTVHLPGLSMCDAPAPLHRRMDRMSAEALEGLMASHQAAASTVSKPQMLPAHLPAVLRSSI